MSEALAVPSSSELEVLTPADRWDLEDTLDHAQGVLREFNDEELRRWVEVEGKTQREIAELVKRSPGRIAQRASRLGLVPHDGRGGRRLLTPKQNGSAPDGPAHHLPDVVADDAEQNLRTQVLRWFEQGAHVKELLDKKRPLEPRSAEDRKAIKREVTAMERVARRIKEAVSG